MPICSFAGQCWFGAQEGGNRVKLIRPRTVVVIVFAAVGAWLSAHFMPILLDSIFNAVERANYVSAPGNVESPSKKPEADKSKPQDSDSQTKPNTPTEQGSGSVATGDEEQSMSPRSTGDTGQGQPKGPSTAQSDVSQSGDAQTSHGYPGSENPGSQAAMMLLGAIIGGALGNMAYGIALRAEHKWDDMHIGDKVSLFLGIFAGIVASMPFLFVFQGLGGITAPLLTFALILGFSTVSIYALKTMEEVLPWQKAAGKRRRTGKKVLDTNVIIDGRILDVARTGFLEGELHVPKFVIEELQHIADSADPLRRQRGRRGLEVLRLLQTDFDLKVGEEDGLIDNGGEVDSRLVKLAKALGADLVSNDYNLNKVAGLQDVRVLNINDLALSLRPNVLPGESLRISVIREGNQPGQGIGYLDDGTMVVIEDGREHIGDTVEANVTQVIQTERGKMIFADYPQRVHASNGRNDR